MTSLGILPLMLCFVTTLSSVIPSWIDRENFLLTLERNSNFLLLRNYLSLMYSFGPRPITSPVYEIISWCPMYWLHQTSDSANFFLKIQAICTSMSYMFRHVPHLGSWGGTWRKVSSCTSQVKNNSYLNYLIYWNNNKKFNLITQS